MVESFVALSIKLEAATRREGNFWLAWCPPIDVITQAETKQAALKSLKEAVELWFESCIARNVLDEALLEAGFHKTNAGELLSKNTSIVKVHEPKPPPRHGFTEKRGYIEVSIPAYIVEQGGADKFACAPLTGRNSPRSVKERGAALIGNEGTTIL